MNIGEDYIVGFIKSSDGAGQYAIRQFEDGALTCECKGFGWRQKCRHIKEYREGLEVIVQVEIVFRRDYRVVTVLKGEERSLDKLNFGDLTSRINETEVYLERLTGLQVSIQTCGL